MSRESRNTALLVKNPIWRALVKQEPVSEQSRTSVGLASRKALYALSEGEGAFEHVKELLVAAHLAIYLAEQGYGPDLIEDLVAAKRDLLACLVRVRDGLPYSLSQEERTRIGELLRMHEQQLELADRGVYSAAILESYKRTSAALTRELSAE